MSTEDGEDIRGKSNEENNFLKGRSPKYSVKLVRFFFLALISFKYYLLLNSLILPNVIKAQPQYTREPLQ